MFARIHTVAFQGLDITPIDVQVQISSGLPAFTIVGLPDKTVAESRERVRAALSAMGLSLPAKRIIINLSPADVQKEGSHYDLPIAVGVLAVMGVLPPEELSQYVLIGELSLDSVLVPITGVLSTALYAYSQDLGIICPYDCGGEAAWAGHINILAPKSLLALINHFKGIQILNPPHPTMEEECDTFLDLKDIKGQETAKRALEITAAGGHNMLMMGPPGAGKSMLAARLPSILPSLTPAEALEVTMIHSFAGKLEGGKLKRIRPFRDPHHSASMPALVGGGLKAMPGEISLAHLGILFLDELPEFSRSALEALRQPLENGRIVISRANARITYPSRIQLIAAMNPCKCGYLTDAERACSKSPKCGTDYQAKISGPLFDRIDIHVDIQNLSLQDINKFNEGESSKIVAERVKKARDIQEERYKKLRSDIQLNAHADGELLDKTIDLTSQGQDLLLKAAEKFNLSMRGYRRILRVSRTIADLGGSAYIEEEHISEALSYRRINFY